ncbi:Pentatricopeptide repeat [Dillenia turbinata]|uniref:Pentatricopeptide repeat n=1 Tax=Dillenia turbinata TaxID=194707 RepID=A0AAN8V2R3_9MAGN
MEVKGVFPDTVTYNTLINAHCRKGLMKEAFELMNSMLDKGLKPGVYTYNAIINGLCKNGNHTRAREVLGEMLQSGLFPDIATYNIWVLDCCRRAKISEEGQLFAEMSCLNIFPDLISYSSLIGLLSRKGHLDRTLAYCRDMKHAGLGLMCEEAMKMRDEMIEQGCSMDVVTYNTLLNGLCNERLLCDATLLFDEIVEKGISPYFCTYSALIHGYCEDGNMDKALSFFQMMNERDIKSDTVTYGMLLDGFCKSGKMEKAYKLWGGVADAFRLWDEMVEKGIGPGLITCNTGRMYEADLMLRKMTDSGANPDRSTYMSLINDHLSQDNLKQAFYCHDEMLQMGFMPDD